MTKVPDYLAAGRSLATLQSDLASLTELTKKMAENADRREARIAELEAQAKDLGMELLVQAGCIQMAEERYGVALDALKRIADAYDDVTGGDRFVAIAKEAVAKLDAMP